MKADRCYFVEVDYKHMRGVPINLTANIWPLPI